MERDPFDVRLEELEAALKSIVLAAEAYMDYHSRTFYGHTDTKPTGLWTEIARARTVLDRGMCDE